MYRLATLLALLLLALAGCGDDSDDGSKSSSPTPATAAQDGPGADDADSGDDADSRKEKASAEADDGRKSKSSNESDSDTLEEALTERAAESTPRQIRELIRIAVVGTIGTYSLELADLKVSDRGRNVIVVVTRRSACYFIAKDEYTMAQKIRTTTRIVRSVRFVAAGSDEELGDYVLRCKRPEMPDGPGTTVLTKSAVGGPVTTKRFTIKGNRWAIEYENRGNSLAVIVIPVRGKGSDEFHEPIGAQKPTAGRKAYRHSGTYMLKVHGPALWTVRVKDIR